MRYETGYAEAIILVRSWILIPLPLLTIIQSFCATAYFVLKGPLTAISRDCMWCVQCGGEVTRHILLKCERNPTENTYDTWL
jgi:hypothetical protein